jgi:hypothetical protein
VKEYEEFLLSEGLITDDMSERIVASLPKCLSDSTMRGSRESLRSSRESFLDSQENLNMTAASCEGLSSATSVWRRRTAPPGAGGCNLRSHWKNFKRAFGKFVDGDDSSPCHVTSSGVDVSERDRDR